jgi:hypothetical protein
MIGDHDVGPSVESGEYGAEGTSPFVTGTEVETHLRPCDNSTPACRTVAASLGYGAVNKSYPSGV